jgi:hypothetical protein
VFHKNLEFGVGEPTDRHGHWRDRIIEMDKDLARLSSMLDGFSGASMRSEELTYLLGDVAGEVPARWVRSSGFTADWPQTCAAGSDLELVVTGDGVADKALPTLHYRHNNQLEAEFKTLEMKRSVSGYRAVIPGKYIDPTWDLLVYVTRVDGDRHVTVFPGFYHSMYPAPYHCIVVK